MTPEMTLWCNVLQQAIWDVGGIKAKLPQKEIPRVQRSARAWFQSSDQTPGSFLWICYILSFEPDAVRKRVLNASPSQIQLFTTDVNAVANEPERADSSTDVDDDESKTAVGF